MTHCNNRPLLIKLNVCCAAKTHKIAHCLTKLSQTDVTTSFLRPSKKGRGIITEDGSFFLSGTDVCEIYESNKIWNLYVQRHARSIDPEAAVYWSIGPAVVAFMYPDPYFLIQS